MSDSATGQVVSAAAEIYDEFFVPALFQQWPPRVAAAALVGAGDRVLDVACGTGVLTNYIAEQVGPTGSVTGLDINEGMLANARRKSPHIEWQEGSAETLPFPDNRFDAVVSQFGLMFFKNRHAALKEMMRVLRPGGHLAVAVWGSIDASPGYAALSQLLHGLFGRQAADAIESPFSLGDPRYLRATFSEAGISDSEISTYQGTANFPSIGSWMFTEIKGWTLADAITDEQYSQLLAEAHRILAAFAGLDGKVSFPIHAHIVAAAKLR